MYCLIVNLSALVRFLFILFVSLACTRVVTRYQACSNVGVACSCAENLHGIEGCVNGKTTGQCACTAPVTPVVAIAGSPSALSSGTVYQASVVAASGLAYSWSVSGATLQSGSSGDSISFTAGTPGVALLTVNVVNSGGDTATPGVLGVNVVAAPANLLASDVDVPTRLTEHRAEIPLRVVHPNPALSYRWSVTGDANATIDPLGIVARLTTANVGDLAVHVTAQNSVGAQSNTVDFPVTVLARQVETLAGATGSTAQGAQDGTGSAASFGGYPMNLAADDKGNLYVGDSNNNIIRRIGISSQIVRTIAGVAGSTDTPVGGIGNQARLRAPVVAALPTYSNTTPAVVDRLLVGEAVASGACPLSIASNIISGPSATLTPLASCAGIAAVLSTVTAIAVVPGVTAKVYASDGTNVISFTLTTGDVPMGLATLTTVVPDDFLPSAVNLAADATHLYLNDGFAIWSPPADFATAWDLASATRFIPITSDYSAGALIQGMVLDGALLVLALGGGQPPSALAGAIFSVLTSATFPTAWALTRLAGSAGGLPSSSVDSTKNDKVSFAGASALAVNPSGKTVFAADRFELRATDTTTGATTLVAGDNVADSDHVVGGPPARFASLSSVAVGPDDTVYLVDSPISAVATAFDASSPSNICKIKTLLPDGTVSTLTGQSCFSIFTNGTLQTATQGLPWGIAFGGDGNLYFSDWEYSEVRKATPSKLLLTAAGNVAPLAATRTPPTQLLDGFAQTATFFGPGALTASPSGEIAIADYFGSIDNTHTNPPGDPYGLVRLLVDGQIITITPPCPIEDGAGGVYQGGLFDGCVGPVGALGIDSAGGIYALAQNLTAPSSDPNNLSSVTPQLFYYAPPAYAAVALTPKAIAYVPGDTPGALVACTPQPQEACATACMRIPPLLRAPDGNLDYEIVTPVIVAGMVVDPVSQDVFFTDQELVRRMHRTDTDCQISIVAGTPGDRTLTAGALPGAFNNLSGLAISPRTLDLYATDNGTNAVLRIRY